MIRIAAMLAFAACASPPAAHPPPTPRPVAAPTSPSYARAIHPYNLVDDECDEFCPPRHGFLQACPPSTSSTGTIDGVVRDDWRRKPVRAAVTALSPTGCIHAKTRVWTGEPFRFANIPTGDDLVVVRVVGIEKQMAARVQPNQTTSISFLFTRADSLLWRSCDCEGSPSWVPGVDYPELPRDRRRP